MMMHYWRLMRFDKPIGTFLLLWPTLWALWIAAQGMPDIRILSIFIAGTIVMRAAGCVINDIIDRKLDPLVARTRNRPIAHGDVSVKSACILFALLLIIALGLVLLLNRFTQILALIGVLLTIVYPFLKRYTHLPQLGLGLAFAWGIPMAFAAQTHHVPLIAAWLFLLTILWIIAYDTEYALVDQSDDIKAGIKSTAVLFGDAALYWIQCLQGFFIAGMMFFNDHYLHSSYLWTSIALSSLCFLYQWHLIKKQAPEAYLFAFRTNTWIGLFIWLGLVCTYPLPF